MKKLNELKIGQTFVGNHACLLNELFATDYTMYRAGSYVVPYEPNAFIWMVYIDGNLRCGWKNRYVNGHDTILEYNTENADDTRGVRYRYRYVFEKRSIGGGAYKFVYMGKYELQKESTQELRVLKKVGSTVSKPSYPQEKPILVTHKKFGAGRIINIADGLVTVSFKTSGVKDFGFPSAFMSGHLFFSDSELKSLSMDAKIDIAYKRYCK